MYQNIACIISSGCIWSNGVCIFQNDDDRLVFFELCISCVCWIITVFVPSTLTSNFINMLRIMWIIMFLITSTIIYSLKPICRYHPKICRVRCSIYTCSVLIYLPYSPIFQILTIKKKFFIWWLHSYQYIQSVSNGDIGVNVVE